LQEFFIKFCIIFIQKNVFLQKEMKIRIEMYIKLFKTMITNELCPVSKNSTDGNKARITAFFVIVLVATSICCLNYYIAGLLAIDFAIRAFSNSKASPIKLAAIGVSKLFHINEKPVPDAPKKLSAGGGMVFCFIIAVLQWFGCDLSSQIVGVVLIFFAFLECAFGFCMGCKVYTLIHILLHVFRKKIIQTYD
jgi:hypothetical protein